MPEFPNINSPDVFDSIGDALIEGGGSGGGGGVQVLYAPGSITGTSRVFLPLGFADAVNTTLETNMQGFVGVTGTGQNLVVQVENAGDVAVSLFINGSTSGDRAFTNTSTYTAGETKTFDVSSVNFTAGDFIGIALEGVSAPGVSYVAIGIVPS
jgi:hypothetical protein